MGKSTHFFGQPVYGHAERSHPPMEFLRTGNHGEDNDDVLPRFLQPVQLPEKDWEILPESASEDPPEPTLFD